MSMLVERSSKLFGSKSPTFLSCAITAPLDRPRHVNATRKHSCRLAPTIRRIMDWILLAAGRPGSSQERSSRVPLLRVTLTSGEILSTPRAEPCPTYGFQYGAEPVEWFRKLPVPEIRRDRRELCGTNRFLIGVGEPVRGGIPADRLPAGGRRLEL